MHQGIEPTLHTDPQAAAVAGWCPCCKGALYAPSLICLRCRRDVP